MVAKTTGTKLPKRELKMADADFESYWQFRMEGVTARLRAAQQIVSHPGTRGALAENLLRDAIREFLPQRWAVGTGFIVNEHGDRSNQIDLLMYDQLTMSPIYRDWDLVILSPGTTHVAVEVKSNLDSREIPSAFKNICSVKRIDPSVMGLIFAYDGVGAERFGEHVTQWSGGEGVPSRSGWPDRVYNMGQEFVVFPGKLLDDGAVADNSPFMVHQAHDPIVRFFLTAAFNRLRLTNLRPFMRADRYNEVPVIEI
jgi:hypothetical protein